MRQDWGDKFDKTVNKSYKQESLVSELNYIFSLNKKRKFLTKIKTQSVSEKPRASAFFLLVFKNNPKKIINFRIFEEFSKKLCNIYRIFLKGVYSNGLLMII